MKWLIIAPERYSIPSPKGTSVETCIYHIARRLARRHDVTVLCKKVSYLPRTTIRGKLRIVRVQGGSKTAYLSSIIRWAKGKSFDCVQVDNRPDFLRKVKASFPQATVSVFLHSLTYVRPPKASTRVVREQLACANVIIANSQSLKRRLIKRFPKQAKKIKVVSLGVETTRFRPPSARERHNIRAKYGANGSFAIVYAGRFIPMKGIPVLIKAADIVRRHIPNTKLYLAGSGKRAYRTHLKKLARHVAVPVHFIGNVGHHAMHEVYWLADCFVCPTQGHEAFGLVVVESLASGTPTVASRNGGIQEVIRHGHNGLLVRRYRDPRAFADAIIRLGKDRKLAGRCGVNGRITCMTRFQWEKTASRLESLYSSNKG